MHGVVHQSREETASVRSEPDGVSAERMSPALGYGLALLFVVLGGASLPLDREIARFMIQYGDEWYWKPIHIAESFAQAWGVIYILFGLYLLLPGRRFQVFHISCAALASGVFCNTAKACYGRIRPRAFDLNLPIGDSFLGWFSFIDTGVRADYLSLPSGHSAMGVGFAVALAMTFPRGRWYFVGLAFLACLQRMVCSAHFLSDVWWGAAIGVGTGTLYYGPGPVRRMFDRWEAERRPASRSDHAHDKQAESST